jgi:hypothetical protein
LPALALVEMAGGGVVVAGCAKPRRGEVGALLGRRPRTLQLNQPDWRPASSAVHSNTSVAACFAARPRSVIWRTLGAIYSIGCRCAIVATESRVAQETVPDRPRPVSALALTMG